MKTTEEMTQIIEGILEYSLVPYSKVHNIDIIELIHGLSEYHTLKQNEKSQINELYIKSHIDYVPDDDNRCISPVQIKRGRGRPKGSVSKNKENRPSTELPENKVIIKRPRGRPPGIKKQNVNNVPTGYSVND